MERPQRVCFVSQAAYGLFDPGCTAPFGGAELQMFVIAKELAKDPSLDVHFLVQDYDQPKSQRFGAITVWRYARPLKHARWAAPIRWIASAASTYWTLSAIKPDTIIETPAGFPTAVAAKWRWMHRRNARFVYWMASDADIEGGISPHALERRIAAGGVKRADLVIAQNSHQRDGLARLGKASIVLRNAFPMRETPPAVAKDGSVLWVSSSQELKQPDAFLDLAEARPTTPFVMVMPRSNVEVFERASARARSLANVEFHESVPYDEIQALFDRARVFVNTSTVEGFPNTFIQAAMGATPVLTLNIDPDGVLGDEGFGVCVKGDAEALARELDALLRDDERVRAMGQAGFAYARREHEIGALVARLRAELTRLWGESA